MDLFWYGLISILGISSLAIASVFRWRWWLRAVVALTVTIVAAVLIYSSVVPITLGREIEWFNTTPFREIILFALMLSGMVARVFSLAIESHRMSARGPSGPTDRLQVDRWEFVY